MLSTEEAQHVAGNPDGCDVSEVLGLALWIGNGVRPMAQAAAIWPNEMVEAIPRYVSTAPIGRLFVVKRLRAYCWNKVTAMKLRVRGSVVRALRYEAICERIYGELPEWARW